jgi:hypothetical protein
MQPVSISCRGYGRFSNRSCRNQKIPYHFFMNIPKENSFRQLDKQLVLCLQCIIVRLRMSAGTDVSPNNKSDRQDIGEILLKEKVDDTNGVTRSWQRPIGPFWRTYDMKCLPNRVVWLVWMSTCHNKTRKLQYNTCLSFLITLRESQKSTERSIGVVVIDW